MSKAVFERTTGGVITFRWAPDDEALPPDALAMSDQDFDIHDPDAPSNPIEWMQDKTWDEGATEPRDMTPEEIAARDAPAPMPEEEFADATAVAISQLAAERGWGATRALTRTDWGLIIQRVKQNSQGGL